MVSLSFSRVVDSVTSSLLIPRYHLKYTAILHIKYIDRCSDNYVLKINDNCILKIDDNYKPRKKPFAGFSEKLCFLCKKFIVQCYELCTFVIIQLFPVSSHDVCTGGALFGKGWFHIPYWFVWLYVILHLHAIPSHAYMALSEVQQLLLQRGNLVR
uniref:Uncharacterized protein n=1 Tax=Aegilops tauschii TaxID=37682 RepID=N1QX09_AEGTA